MRYLFVGSVNASGRYLTGSYTTDLKLYLNTTDITPVDEKATLVSDGKDGWVEMDDAYVSINSTTEKIDWESVKGSIDNLYKDITSVSDTAWVLRGVINFSAGINTGTNYWTMGIARNGTTGGNNDPTNSIICKYQNESGANKWKISDGATNVFSNTGTMSIDTDYYWILKRTDADTASFDMKTGSHSGSSVTSFPIELTNVSSNATSLTTVYFANRDNSGSGSMSGTVSNLQLWKTTSSTSGSPDYEPDWSKTNLPENTLFEETDTYKTYWLQSNATWMEQIPPMTYMVMAGKSGSPKDKIDRVTIATDGNATSFGTLNIGREKPTGLSNESRGLICGGEPAQAITDIESIMIGTGAQSADYGDLVSIRQRAGGVNAATIDRGLVGGGQSSGNTAVIDYLTIGTGGTAGDFGDLTQARAWVAEAWSDTIGCFCNGYTSSAVDTMDYVTMATLGNATDFGNSTVGRYSSDGLTDKTRGVICGGYSSSQLDVMDYITIDTPANATDFGNLSDSAENSYAGGDLKTKGLIASDQLTVLTEIQQITVATAANSTSFGELDTCTNDGCVMNGI
jgi:hypothetical protein